MASELDAMDATHLASRRIHSLSSGELQRIRMARLALSDAPLWLLDEPTSNLDPRFQIRLLNRMQAHCKQGGAAIAIMHDLALVERFFANVLLIVDGCAIAYGPTKDTLTPKLLSSLYDAQATREPAWAFSLPHRDS